MDPELKEFNSNRQGMFDDDVIESQLDPSSNDPIVKRCWLERHRASASF